jgi:ABC-type antimicrobial peptide transport system permease subunit
VGVFLAAAVSTAILTGALLVGDSVKFSLARMVSDRLGDVDIAVAAEGRFFRAKLAEELSEELNAKAASMLQLRGIVSNDDGSARANRVEILGVDKGFFELARGTSSIDIGGDGIAINEALAKRLGAAKGDDLVIRVPKPSAISRDAPLTPEEDQSIAFRLKVQKIIGREEFGNFSLQANQVTALNAFVDMEWLGEKLELEGLGNTILLDADVTAEAIDEAIKERWELADTGLSLRELEDTGELELLSRRIFIDDSLAAAAKEADSGAKGILTYFVNEIRAGGKATPYSFISSLEAGEVGIGDDEILINQWLADDIGAKAGDEIEVSYYVVSRMRRLEERSRKFKVRKVVPIEEVWADGSLMPAFEGLSDVENCRDWEPGIPIDLDNIRDKDEEYWDEYRGTPKAFVTLKAGQAMWANRFGGLTAVRYDGKISSETIAERILKNLEPAEAGLNVLPIRELNDRASTEGTDFGQLFLGLSMFLIAAAVVLTGLVFVFGVEKRSQQAGILLALGFKPGLIKGVFILEGGVIAAGGAVAGAIMGMAYTRAMIIGLETVWQDAVASSAIEYHAEMSTVIVGGISGLVVSLIAILLMLRKYLRQSPAELLAGTGGQYFGTWKQARYRISLSISVLSFAAAIVLLIATAGGASGQMAAGFFGAGALLLIASISVTAAGLKFIEVRWQRRVSNIGGLGVRNLCRRRGRSLAVVGLMAAASFMVVSIGANRHDFGKEAELRGSGTGGFGLYGEAAIGVLNDLNTWDKRASLGLIDERVVQMRVKDGDDASCLNLNRAQRPRLLGVNANELAERGAFGFTKLIEGADTDIGWEILEEDFGEAVVPAVADYTTIIWSLGKKIGDTIEYVDEKGRRFQVLIAGMIKNSILQGTLIISAEDFEKRFGSEEGFRVLLVDVDNDRRDEVGRKLALGLRDQGLEMIDASDRLAEFGAVENTYLAIFQLLGGLGLILGSIGLGLVVLRNVLDRQGELSMMRAIGFSREALRKMILLEHAGLLLWGLGCGVICAVVAVWPAMDSESAMGVAYSIAAIVLAILLSGILWIWLAAAAAMSGKLLDGLRNE